MIWLTKVFSLLPSACATEVTARMLGVASLLTRVRSVQITTRSRLKLNTQSLTLIFQTQEAIYDLLTSLQTEILSFMKDGLTGRDVYQHALNFVKEKKPELEKNFVKNIGHGVSPAYHLFTYITYLLALF
jgi:nucleosome binding factor SPN SPT16 subunit